MSAARQKRFDVTSFGESMLRLSVPVGQRLEMCHHLDVHVAGAETNTLSALARLEHACGWVGALPRNPLGRLVQSELRRAGIDLSAAVWRERGRLGTYYVEFAVPPRAIQVVYDRAGSATTELHVDQIDWTYLLDTRLIHLTGITPALSPGCAEIVAQAVARAQEAGVVVSFDVNYRSKLWTAELAREHLLPLMQGVDLLFCSDRDARTLFGCSGSPQQVVERLVAQTSARRAVVSLGERGVIGWDGDEFTRVPARPVEIVDRIGAGDALAAGVIHGLLGGDFAGGLHTGVLMAALVLSQHGDMLVTSPAEIAALLESDGAGVSR